MKFTAVSIQMSYTEWYFAVEQFVMLLIKVVQHSQSVDKKT